MRAGEAHEVEINDDEPRRTGEANVDETKTGWVKPTTAVGLEINCEPIGAHELTNEPFETIKAILKMCFGVLSRLL